MYVAVISFFWLQSVYSYDTVAYCCCISMSFQATKRFRDGLLHETKMVESSNEYMKIFLLTNCCLILL